MLLMLNAMEGCIAEYGLLPIALSLLIVVLAKLIVEETS